MYEFEKPGVNGTKGQTDAVDMGDSFKREHPPSNVYQPYPFEKPGD